MCLFLCFLYKSFVVCNLLVCVCIPDMWLFLLFFGPGQATLVLMCTPQLGSLCSTVCARASVGDTHAKLSVERMPHAFFMLSTAAAHTVLMISRQESCSCVNLLLRQYMLGKILCTTSLARIWSGLPVKANGDYKILIMGSQMCTSLATPE